jgi:hypothetical protein
MITGEAGGHKFIDGVCSCGRKLVDLQHISVEADLNKPDIAHSGGATKYEIEQILALAARMRTNIENAFGWRHAPAEAKQET